MPEGTTLGIPPALGIPKEQSIPPARPDDSVFGPAIGPQPDPEY
jgi:hypothetical protein